MPTQISSAAARRFLVLRHLLAPPRSLPPATDSVMRVVERLGSLQFDPLDVAGRNHDLVLQARIAGYRRELTDDLLYRSRSLFETYNKALNLLPTHQLPYYRISWARGLEGRAGQLVGEQAVLADKILAEIRDSGPKCSLDFEREAAIDWWWGPTTAVRAVLEALCVSGTIGLSRRDGNRRYYDLIERLFPAELLAEHVSERDQLRHKLLSRHRAHGLLGGSGSAEIWIGTGKAPLRTELRNELVDRGELVRLTVEGVKGERFVLATELPILARAEAESDSEAARAGAAEAGYAERPAVSFIAPLDPLMWDRALLIPLYDFDYIWEVYTPAAKRQWGYYVLPVLFGDRLVGRIEPRLNRREKSARIASLGFEPGFDPMEAPGFVDAFADALHAYMAFGNAKTLDRSDAVAGSANRALFRALAGRVRMKRPAGTLKSGRRPNTVFNPEPATAAQPEIEPAAAPAAGRRRSRAVDRPASAPGRRAATP
jgi:uncharacterized protein